jgi:hypothetical protein
LTPGSTNGGDGDPDTRHCRSSNVDINNYEVKHVRGECRCSIISIPVEKVVDIIHKDGIPVFALKPDKHLDIRRVGERKDEAPEYMAISHVWADGLGNPTQNALPLCQVERIQSLVNSRSGKDGRPVFIWMDTLCIPITADGEARKKSISNMGLIYEKALGTLVLDAELITHSKNVDLVERVSRIFYSRWATRLWTLQEAAANVNFVVQFKDGTVSFPEMLRERTAILRAHDYTDPITFEAFRWMQEIGNLTLRKDNDDRYMSAINAACYRNTSHKRDEIICAAGLLRFTRKQILCLLEHPEAQRTAEFLRIWGYCPSSLIFAQGPFYTSPGFRSCPREFLAAWAETAVVNAPPLMRVTKEGFVGTFKGLILITPDAKPDVRTVDHDSRHFVFRDSLEQTWYAGTLSSTTAIDVYNYHQSRRLAMILQTNSTQQIARCLLVEILRESDHIYFVHRIDRGTFAIENSRPGGYMGRHCVAINVHVMPDTQTWCVD